MPASVVAERISTLSACSGLSPTEAWRACRSNPRLLEISPAVMGARAAALRLGLGLDRPGAARLLRRRAEVLVLTVSSVVALRCAWLCLALNLSRAELAAAASTFPGFLTRPPERMALTARAFRDALGLATPQAAAALKRWPDVLRVRPDKLRRRVAWMRTIAGEGSGDEGHGEPGERGEEFHLGAEGNQGKGNQQRVRWTEGRRALERIGTALPETETPGKSDGKTAGTAARTRRRRGAALAPSRAPCPAASASEAIANNPRVIMLSLRGNLAPKWALFSRHVMPRLEAQERAKRERAKGRREVERLSIAFDEDGDGNEHGERREVERAGDVSGAVKGGSEEEVPSMGGPPLAAQGKRRSPREAASRAEALAEAASSVSARSAQSLPLGVVDEARRQTELPRPVEARTAPTAHPPDSSSPVSSPPSSSSSISLSSSVSSASTAPCVSAPSPGVRAVWALRFLGNTSFLTSSLRGRLVPRQLFLEKRRGLQISPSGLASSKDAAIESLARDAPPGSLRAFARELEASGALERWVDDGLLAVGAWDDDEETAEDNGIEELEEGWQRCWEME